MTEITSTTLYRKKGRRYFPAYETTSLENPQLRVKHGESIIITCTNENQLYMYEVDEAKATWHAAANRAKQAMIKAIEDAAIYSLPHGTKEYTPQQKEIIERFQKEMAATGGLLPEFWTSKTSYEIAQAGIDAVKTEDETKQR